MSRDLDTAGCIYCRLPKKAHHPRCPVRRSRWEDLKAWGYVTLALVAWLLLLGGFREIAELIYP